MAKPFQTPQPQVVGHEYQPGDETGYTSDMITHLENQLRKMYPNGETLRQAHPKMHGCVAAEFIVNPDLPENLRVGLFKEATTFPAWIRFSNASTKVKPDSKKDVRGMAIKLMKVPGQKLMNEERDAFTHDFNLISHEVFVSKDVKQFSKLMKALTTGPLHVVGFFLNPFHWGVLIRTMQSFIKIDHVLNIPYYSTTPYQFGDENRAVKYHVSPHAFKPNTFKASSKPDYLRENLAQALASGDAYFDFCVQFQEDAKLMPIENPTVKWNSTFHKLATIRIPQQVFDTDDQNDFGKWLSFTPWHALPEHRPIGGMNRARLRVYEALSKFRHQRNQEPYKEPATTEITPHTPPGGNHNNLQVIKDLYAFYAQKDVKGILSCMAGDIVWTEPGAPNIKFAGTYKGKLAIVEMLLKEKFELDLLYFTPQKFFTNDTQVTVLGKDSATVKHTGKTYTTDWNMHFSLYNGKITSVQTYMDTEAIAKAFIKD